MEKEQKERLVGVAQHILKHAKVIKEGTNCTQIEATTIATALFADVQQEARLQHLQGMLQHLATGGADGGSTQSGILVPN